MSRWPMVSLGDLCVQDRQQTKESSLPYIGLEHVVSGSGEILFDSDNPITVNGTSFLFDNRHVLYGKLRPYLNKVVLPDFQGRCSMELIPLRPKPGVLREFVAAVLRHPNTISLAVGRNTGSRMPRADMRQVLAMPAPLPPLDEQRRIVDLLNRAAGIRRLREQALATARNTIPALFLQTFGDPATNPKGWPVVPLGNLVISSRYGPRFHDRGYAEHGARILRTTDIHFEGRVTWENAPKIEVLDAELERYALRPNTLLVTRTGATIGKVALFEGFSEPCIAGAYLIEFNLANDCEPLFVLNYLMSRYGQSLLVQGGRAVAQPNINAPTVKALPIPLPPLDLQRRFADRLADLRGIVTQQERALATARTLERALLARLLG